ncbi:MAG: flagellar filament capping protein FliD, partial [Myxococcales bacterium]|nr:flagellar filament capping protein FliD [Myxococcales bacterium]
NGLSSEGTYSFTIDKLAKEQRTISTGYTTSSAPLSQSGSLDITVGGDAAINVPINAGDSLADIAANINDSGARVKASVVYDGTDYHLMVRGDDSGAANAVTFGGTATLGLDVPANNLQTADDAQITLAGGLVITRSTNQFDGVIEGVSLTLKDQATGPVTVSVGRDGAAMKDKIKSLVSAFNDAISIMQSSTGYGALKASHEELTGDSAIRSATSRLSSVFTNPVPGLGGRYDMLASVGLHLTQNGKLELDEAALDKALADDVGAVERVFVGDPDNNIDGAMALLSTAVEKVATGDDSILQLRIDAMGDQADGLTDQADRLDRRLEDYEANLRKKFTALEVTIARINAQSGALTSLYNLSTNNSG